MSRTYRNIGHWGIDLLETPENWDVPQNHETTYRACRYLGNGVWGPVEEFTRSVRYGNFVPMNVRRYKMRTGRRPLGRDGMTNCACSSCGPTERRRHERRVRRHRGKELIRIGRWDDLPLPLSRELW